VIRYKLNSCIAQSIARWSAKRRQSDPFRECHNDSAWSQLLAIAFML
jgi:hypothetical protein